MRVSSTGPAGTVSDLDLNDPTAVLLAVADALRAAGVDAAAYGGLALAAYGEARETKDADLATAATPAATVGAALGAALGAAGLPARRVFDRVRMGGNLVTRLTLVASGAATPVDFDEPRSARYARVTLARALEGTLRDRPVRVVTPEDFIILKVLSTRERDLEDAASVVRALADRLDMPTVEREVERLVAEVSDHDVAGRFSRAIEMSRRA